MKLGKTKLILCVAIVTTTLVVLISSRQPIRSDTVVQTSPDAEIQKTRESEPSKISEPPPPSIEEVTQVVNTRNADTVKRLETFKTEGWEEVKVDDLPDQDVMQLSLNLLGHREAELQTQIQSNSFTGDMFERLTEIAVTTTDEKTRYVALEALGRSGEKGAQLQLTRAFEQIADEETRSQILGYLIPAEPDDEIAVFLAEQVADPNTSDDLKKQAAFPLAAMSLLTTTDPEEAIERVSMDMPEEWKDNFASLVNLLATGGHQATNE